MLKSKCVLAFYLFIFHMYEYNYYIYISCTVRHSSVLYCFLLHFVANTQPSTFYKWKKKRIPLCWPYSSSISPIIFFLFQFIYFIFKLFPSSFFFFSSHQKKKLVMHIWNIFMHNARSSLEINYKYFVPFLITILHKYWLCCDFIFHFFLFIRKIIIKNKHFLHFSLKSYMNLFIYLFIVSHKFIEIGCFIGGYFIISISQTFNSQCIQHTSNAISNFICSYLSHTHFDWNIWCLSHICNPLLLVQVEIIFDNPVNTVIKILKLWWYFFSGAHAQSLLNKLGFFNQFILIILGKKQQC